MNVKKKYISPKLEAVEVDRNIILMEVSERGAPSSPSEGRDNDDGSGRMFPNRMSQEPFSSSPVYDK